MFSVTYRWNDAFLSITKTRLYNIDPLKPHFYIVKLGFTGVYIIFLISAQNIDCEYSLEPPHRGGSNEYTQSLFWAEIWKISEFFLSENCQFLEVKFSIYLNRSVFVMVFELSVFLVVEIRDTSKLHTSAACIIRMVLQKSRYIKCLQLSMRDSKYFFLFRNTVSSRKMILIRFLRYAKCFFNQTSFEENVCLVLDNIKIDYAKLYQQ